MKFARNSGVYKNNAKQKQIRKAVKWKRGIMPNPRMEERPNQTNATHNRPKNGIEWKRGIMPNARQQGKL
jgi:hypothetical protein